MWQKTKQLLEMIRFSHTVFALPFAILASIMAWLTPSTQAFLPDFSRGLVARQLACILICMVGARSAAMAFNRIVDRDIDADNPRTAQRHLPAGLVTLRQALLFTVVSSLVFVAGTALFLPNYLPLLLAAPVLLFLFGYSYTKRFTSLAHFYLGVSLMLAPICAWLAIRGPYANAPSVLSVVGDLYPPALLGLAVLLWVSGFDIIYACQDVDYDRRTQLRSIPVRLGVAGGLRMAAACHFLMIAALAALPLSAICGGPPLDLGWIYWLGIAGVAILLTYEHALVRPDDLSRVNMAFFNVNSVVSIGLLIVGTIDMLV